MRSLIQNRDLKTLFGGVSIAAVAGLLMGGVMYPNLDEDEVGGPQIQTAGGGARTDTAGSHVSVADYGARIPDYVIGTDALKPPPYQALAYNDLAEPEYADTGEAADVTAYAAPDAAAPAVAPHDAPSYPSEHGNGYNPSDLPPPPDAPSEADEDWEPA